MIIFPDIKNTSLNKHTGIHIGTYTFGFPPRIISVPLPAIFVDIVMACFRPACATISASLPAYCELNEG